jgi:photosystem II stability/assembly factor-like uncharacterized protein
MLLDESAIGRRAALGRLATGAVAGSLACALAAVGRAASAATSPASGSMGSAGGLNALRDGVLIAGRVVGRHVWVSDNRGHLYASDDGGANWQVQGGAARGALTALAFGVGSARAVGVAVGHRSAVLRSADGGRHWAVASLPTQESVSLLDAVVLSPSRVLAVGAFGAGWQSDDAGASWRAVQPVKGDRHYNACAANAQGQVVIVGESGLILHSPDGGQSWVEAASPVKASLFAVTATGAGHFVAAGLGGTVLWSVDGGQQWAAFSTPARHAWLGATALDDGSVLLAGGGGALCRLQPDAVGGGWHATRQVREGYGAWSSLLPCTPAGAAPSVLAVGETGLRRLDLAPWLQGTGSAL